MLLALWSLVGIHRNLDNLEVLMKEMFPFIELLHDKLQSCPFRVYLVCLEVAFFSTTSNAREDSKEITTEK